MPRLKLRPQEEGINDDNLTFERKDSFPLRVPLILANQPCIVEGGGRRREPSERNW
jgi:hypothetical protein